jgi:hypothetical protein
VSFKTGDKVQELATGLWGTMREINGALVFEFETRQGGKQSARVFKPAKFISYNGVLHPQDAPFPEGSYAECLRTSMLSYPSLYMTEADVLEQLFFVNGNGYEWEDGRLTAGESLAEALVASRRAKEQSRKMREDTRARFVAFATEKGISLKNAPSMEDDEAADSDDPEIQRAYWTRRTAEMRKQMKEVETIYPLCIYADILNVPFNARTDWQRAARKALDKVAPTKVRTAEDDRFLAVADELLKCIERRDEAGYAAACLRLFTAEESARMTSMRRAVG